MDNQDVFKIEENDEFGAYVICSDIEVADEFDDFMSESEYVLFNIKVEATSMIFYFGRASSPHRVKMLIDRFSKTRRSKRGHP